MDNGHDGIIHRDMDGDIAGTSTTNRDIGAANGQGPIEHEDVTIDASKDSMESDGTATSPMSGHDAVTGTTADSQPQGTVPVQPPQAIGNGNGNGGDAGSGSVPVTDTVNMGPSSRIMNSPSPTMDTSPSGWRVTGDTTTGGMDTTRIARESHSTAHSPAYEPQFDYSLPFGGPSVGTVKTHRPMPMWGACVITGVVSTLLSLGLGLGAVSSGIVNVPAHDTPIAIGGGNGQVLDNTGGADVWAAVSDKVKDSVVSITAENNGSESSGSGAVLNGDGYIVTNDHVVDGAENGKVTVALYNGSIVDAKVIGTDPSTDIAVVKLDSVPKTGLTPVVFADSDDLAVGQGVLSIGSPLGYDNTVTTGVISALDRPVVIPAGNASNGLMATNAIQIDSAINPGNSGGPTFDSSGRVIGINSSIATVSDDASQAGNVGIGFAIPSNVVRRIAGDIIKNGHVVHVQLGVSMNGNPVVVSVDGVNVSGAKVAGVVDGSPASKAGLKAGDVIVAWNGKPVSSSASVMSNVRGAQLNDDATVGIVRDGKRMDVMVTLDQKDTGSGDAAADDSNGGNNGSGSSGIPGDLGDMLRKFGFDVR